MEFSIKPAKDILHNLKYYNHQDDSTAQLQNAIHNYRQSASGEVKKLHQVMRKSRTTNV